MDLIVLMDMYEHNDKFKEYVDKYSRTHGIAFVENALKCIMVQNYAEYLMKEEKHEY